MKQAEIRTRYNLHRLGSLATAARESAWAQVPDAESLKTRAIQARDRVLHHLPDYLTQLESAAHQHGISVLHASSAQDANRLVIQTLRDLGITEALRNHHPLLDEIQIQRAALANQIQLTPIHPGDHLALLADTPPGHPIWPVGHLPIETLSQALQTRWGIPPIYDPDHLASTVRMPLRRQLLQSNTAILGVHFGVAQDGTLVLLDNDGHNASILSLARHLILLLSVDQLVADLDDLDALIQVYALSAWARPLPAFINHLQSPAPQGMDGPRTLHLILVDNHRTRLLAQGLVEPLRCIQCGACQTVCPVFQQIGAEGYAYAPYTGPIGTIINPLLLRPDLGEPQAYLCDNAGHCQTTCPLDIDFAHWRTFHRQRLAQAGRHDQHTFFRTWQRLIPFPQLFRPFWRRATRS